MQGMTSEPETLIVAVSGGIDSVVMLDRLVKEDSRHLIVAHVDHGIREDSGEDRAFVESLARNYGLEFVATELHLDPDVSEDGARQARYAWLEKVRDQYGATKVATAHHQDDVLETIVINIVRGTGWRGLCSLRESARRHRPLLELSKVEIIEYAVSHGLEWREDSTNESVRYLRNRIRNFVIPRLSPERRVRFIELYGSQVALRRDITRELEGLYPKLVGEEGVDRHMLIMTEENVAIELIRTWLGESLEHSRFRDLLLFAKTARPGAKWSLDGQRFVLAKPRTLIVSPSRD